MYLDLSFKNLTTLHEFDLTRVTQLYCGYNQLTSLPPLPETLKELSCSNNQLTSLPPLPETLKILDCTNNRLLLFSTVFSKLSPTQLAEWIIADRLPVRFQLQQHKYLWEPNARGV